ncbi:MAG: filamentous hemagglutinin N-terminal domain-containing protein [Phycisphaerales bacterium]
MFKARAGKAVGFRSSNTGASAGRGASTGRGSRGRRGGGLGLAGPVLTVLCIAALPAEAGGPRNGRRQNGVSGQRVVSGEASFSRSGRTTTITASDRAIIEYDRFNIGRRQTVEFVQPGAESRVLNRITGGDPSHLRGTLRSNGIVYFVNPAGVIFGPNSRIDVGGLYAAGANLSNRDFLAGNDHFTNVQGRVVNRGEIHSDSVTALIGRRVANFGSVVAPTGTVTMVAGDEVWIGERDGHIYARFSVDAASERVQGGVANHGAVVADQFYAGVGDYFALAVFDTSQVRARIAQVRGGTGTTTSVAGVIDVSNQTPGGVGGSVTVTGERVALRDATIDASGHAGGGDVRIGGDYQGRGDIPNAERTYLSSGTTINADATVQGDGGRVIVWSDVFTNYNASISARGGAQGGDGGFAEVSGKDTLAFHGTANLSATDGAAGTLLLDPKDIVIDNAGSDPVLANNEFGEDPTGTVTMDPADLETILDAGTALVLQANNDITVNDPIDSTNPGPGVSGDLTMQAGRSVVLNANITLEDASLSITANETLANGVVDAQRDAGAAVISMADGVAIDVGTGNVTMTLSTGAGLTNFASGNITVEDITTTGNVTITNNGPTAGSSILVEATGPDSLITAANLALSAQGAGGGGAVGASGMPIAFTATNVEAAADSGGIFLDTTSTVNIGGASGSLTGLATTNAGAIEVATGAGNLNTSENITGTGTVDLTGTAIGLGGNVVGNDDVVLTGPITITGSRTISAGAGQLDVVSTVAVGAGDTATFIGTPDGATPAIGFQANVTPGAGSVLVFEQATNATAFNVNGANTNLLDNTNGLNRLQDGFSSITIGRADGTQSIAVGALTFNDPVTIRTAMGNINLNGALAGAGDASITLTPGPASRVLFNANGTILSTANQNITINGAARVGEGFASTVSTGAGAGNISITGIVDGTNAGAAETVIFNAGTGSLTTGVLGAGQALDLETITITNAGITTLGGVNTLGTFSTTNPLTGAFNATGAAAAGTVTVNGTSIDFDSTLTGDAGGIALNGTAVTLDGLASTTTNGNIAITNSGLLSINGGLTSTGSFTQTNNGGTVTVASDVSGVGATFNSATTISGTRSVSATTGALAFNSTLGFSGGPSTATLTGATIAFAANVTPQSGQTALVFQSPTVTDAFGVANGAGNQLISGASLAFLQNGFTQLTFGRAAGQHAIGIGAVSFQDPVRFQTPSSGNITVSGLITGTDDASVTLDTGAGPARIILDVTGNTIVTAGDTILFDGLVRVAEGEAPVIDSAGGLIRFGGAVDGTTGGAAESLTLDAGTGNIDFQTVASAISGAGGAADATGLATLTITDATALSLQSLLITGAFTTTNPLGGAVQALGTVQAGTINLDADSFDFDAAVTAGAGGIDLSGGNGINFDSTLTAGAGGVTMLGNIMTFDALVSTSGGGDVGLNGSAITLTGGITTAGGAANVALTNSGLLTIGNDVTADGTFTQNNNGGAVSLAGDINTSSADGLIQFNSAVTATAGLELNAGAGAVDLNSTFAAGANDIVFTTNDFLPSGDSTVTGTGQVTLRPENVGDAINIGSAAGGAPVATYDLSDFAALANGFATIHIGYDTTGTHTVRMGGFNGGSALRDDLEVHAPMGGGNITLLDSTDTGGNDLTFDGVFAAGAALTIDTGTTGQLAFADDAGFGANNIALVGDIFATFGGTLTGSGELIVEPTTATRAIDIGTVGAPQGGMVIPEAFIDAVTAADFTSLRVGQSTTGQHSIFLGALGGITPLDFDFSLVAPVNGAGNLGEVRLHGDVTLAANNIVFDADVRVDNTLTPTITTGGGNASFMAAIFGTTTGADETLTVDAGAGDITVDGTISGQIGGGTNATGLTQVTLTGASVDLNGVNIVAGSTNGDGSLTVNNSGLLTLGGAINAAGGFSQTNAGGTTNLGGNITTVNTPIAFMGAVTQIADAELRAGTGEIAINAAFNTAGFDLTLASRDIDINAALSGGDGTNTLTLEPDADATPIEIGNGTSMGAGALLLSATDIGNIADGFGAIEIGIAGSGAHAFEIGGAGFTDPLTLRSPMGSFTVLANRTLSGTDDASITFDGSHATLTLNNGSRITTAGTNIDIDDDILLADGAGNSGMNADIPLISTGAMGGDIRIDGSIRGTDIASGMVERLRVEAGTGSLTVGDVLNANGTQTNIFGALMGMTEVASDQGLIDFGIVSASTVTLEGVNIAGLLESEAALTGAFTANESVLAQAITLAGTTFDFLDGFEATNNGGGTAAFTNSGLVTTTEGEADGDITTTGNLTATTLDAGGSIAVGGNLDLGDEAIAGTDVSVIGTSTIGDRIIAGNNITLTGDATFAVNAGATDRGLFAGGSLTADGINTNAQDTTLSGAEINFTGGSASVMGGGSLALEPDNAARDINVGTPAMGNPGATSLDLTDTDLAAIASGFDSVTIGIAGGTHDIVFGSSNFRNATVINYQNGTANITGNIVATGAASSLAFLGGDSGGTTLSANVTTDGADITFDDDVTLGAASVVANNGAGNGTGTIDFDGAVDGAFALTVIGTDGGVDVDGAIGATTPLASLAISGANVSINNGIGTMGAAGVAGSTAITGASTLTLLGEFFNTNEAFYDTAGFGTIEGAGMGTTATFLASGDDISFTGGGSFDVEDGVGLTINPGPGGTIVLAADFQGANSGDLLFSRAVTLDGGVNIGGPGGMGGSVTFADTIDGAFDLSVSTGADGIFLQGDVGTGAALASLTLDSGDGVELANIGAADSPGVTGAVDVDAAADITYNGTEYASGSANYNAAGQHSVVSGDTTFATSGGALTFAGGNIVLTDGSDLTATSSGGMITTTAIRGASDENVTINAGAGQANLAAIGMDDEIGDISITANQLQLTGNIVGNTFTLLTGTAGRGIELAGDGTTPGALLLSRAEFARLQDGFTSITIGRDDGIGAILVGGDNGGPLDFSDPLTLRSQGNGGSVSVLEGMSGSGDASLMLLGTNGFVGLSGPITTAGGDVTIEGASTLLGDTSIETSGGNVAFLSDGTINSPGTAFALDIDAGTGAVAIDGAIGLANRLASTDFRGSTIAIRAVNTVGGQTYTGQTFLGGSLSSRTGPILFDGNTTVTTDASVSAGDGMFSNTANVTFRGAIDGSGADLTVVADGTSNANNAQGTAAFEGPVTDVGNFIVLAGTIDVRDVTTNGPQTYVATNALQMQGDLSTAAGGIDITGPVVLLADSSITTGDGDDRDIDIDGTVDGAFALALDAGENDITVADDIGATDRLGDLTIAAARNVSLQGVRLANMQFSQATTGQVTIAGALDADGDTGVNIDSGRSIDLAGPVDVASNLALTANEGVTTRGTVDVGDNLAITALNVRLGDGAGDTVDVGGLMRLTSIGANASARFDAPVIIRGTDVGAQAAAILRAQRLDVRNRLEVTRGTLQIDNAGNFLLNRANSQIVLNGNDLSQIGTGQSVFGTGISSAGSELAFAGPILLQNDVTFESRRFIANGTINSDSDATRRALTINTNGRTELSGEVGSTTRLASLTTDAAGGLVSGGTTFIRNNVFVAGDLAINDNVVTGPETLPGDAVLIETGGAATFARRASMAADIVSMGPVTFQDAVLLRADTSVDTSSAGSAGRIAFLGPIDADVAGNGASLSLQTDMRLLGPDLATISFGAPIGATNPIGDLELNLGQNVPGLGNLTRDQIAADPQFQTVTINGETLAGVTAALVPTIVFQDIAFDPNAAPDERGIFIRTEGDIRTGAGEKMAATFAYDRDSFGNYALDNAGRHLVTINNQTVSIRSAATRAGGNAPALGLFAGGNVVIGDVTVDGDLDVRAGGGTIRFQPRQPGFLLTRPQIDPRTGMLETTARYLERVVAAGDDSGLDIFLNGVGFFDRAPLGPGAIGTTYAPEFGAASVGQFAILSVLRSDFDPSQLEVRDANELGVLGLSGSIILDLGAEGTTTSSANVIQRPPNEAQTSTVTEATTIGVSAKEALADLGINARDPVDLLDALIGRALYNDLSGTEYGSSFVTANRVSLEVANDVVNEYNAFLRRLVLDENGQPVIDPETGRYVYESRQGEIQAGLTAALRRHRSQARGPLDPVAFRRFIRSSAQYDQVEQDLLSLERVLTKLRALGLSSGEYINVRDAILRLVKPTAGISEAELLATVEAGKDLPPASQLQSDSVTDQDLIDVLDQPEPDAGDGGDGQPDGGAGS